MFSKIKLIKKYSTRISYLYLCENLFMNMEIINRQKFYEWNTIVTV